MPSQWKTCYSLQYTQASSVLKDSATPPQCLNTVNAAVIVVLHARLLSQEQAHPADLDDLYAQTWHHKIVDYKSNSFSNLTVLAVKGKKY